LLLPKSTKIATFYDLYTPLRGKSREAGKGGGAERKLQSVKQTKGKRQTETTKGKGGFAHPPSRLSGGLPPQGGQTPFAVCNCSSLLFDLIFCLF
jgi:hypothetical protein